MFSANSSQVSDEKLYVEDVFSTYLYTGTSTADNKITNGIDLAGKGGMVWLKSRTGAYSNYLTTNSTTTSSGGGTTWLYSDTTDALLGAVGNGLCNFFSDGFDINATGVGINGTGNNYASWTFRKAPKFFDVVTYTGTGANRTIAHNLGVAPGCILIKRTNTSGDWQVYHRGIANTQYMVLNSDAAVATGTTRWNSTTPTATEFTVGTDATVNASGGTYVAYLFAHDATPDGIIQCGAAAAQTNINLGWEPQFVIIKKYDAIQTWFMNDNMRGMSVGGNTASDLYPNTSAAEVTGSNNIFINSTGFNINLTGNYIYIAIRRGPMKTPTLGTSVFAPVSQTPSGVTTITTGFSVDMTWLANRSKASFSFTADVDRLRGTTQTSTRLLLTNGTDAEAAVNTYGFGYDRMTSITDNYSNSNWGATTPVIYWNFKRAPGFFDEVCYTGTGVARTINHNLGVVPELMIVKSRNLAGGYWAVYANALGNSKTLYLNLADAPYTSNEWNNTSPTSTVYSVSGNGNVNGGGYTYVAYLFASCPGVSKVGSYTGNGSSQTINCGFAAGARFVLIKRTNASGDWYVWDTARGIVAGNDPHLSLNTTAAEVTTDDTIDTDSSGFVVNQVAATNVNVSSATYIYLAIA